jgi:hypothetical protein
MNTPRQQHHHARISLWGARRVWSRLGIWLLLASILLLWASGVAVRQIPEDVLFAGPLWLARTRLAAHTAHGLAAWGAILLAGRWVWPHVTQSRRLWRRRPSGPLLLATGAALAVSGMALGYTPLAWHEALVGMHWWLGFVWPAALLLHAVKRIGLLMRKRRAAPGLLIPHGGPDA